MDDPTQSQAFTTLGQRLRAFGQQIIQRYHSPGALPVQPPDQPTATWEPLASEPMIWRDDVAPPLPGEMAELPPDQAPGGGLSWQYARQESPPPVQRQVDAPGAESAPPAPTPRPDPVDPMLRRIVGMHRQREAEREAIRQQRIENVQRQADATGKPPSRQRSRAKFDYVQTAPLRPEDELLPDAPPPAVHAPPDVAVDDWDEEFYDDGLAGLPDLTPSSPGLADESLAQPASQAPAAALPAQRQPAAESDSGLSRPPQPQQGPAPGVTSDRPVAPPPAARSPSLTESVVQPQAAPSPGVPAAAAAADRAPVGDFPKGDDAPAIPPRGASAVRPPAPPEDSFYEVDAPPAAPVESPDTVETTGQPSPAPFAESGPPAAIDKPAPDRPVEAQAPSAALPGVQRTPDVSPAREPRSRGRRAPAAPPPSDVPAAESELPAGDPWLEPPAGPAGLQVDDAPDEAAHHASDDALAGDAPADDGVSRPVQRARDRRPPQAPPPQDRVQRAPEVGPPAQRRRPVTGPPAPQAGPAPLESQAMPPTEPPRQRRPPTDEQPSPPRSQDIVPGQPADWPEATSTDAPVQRQAGQEAGAETAPPPADVFTARQEMPGYQPPSSAEPLSRQRERPETSERPAPQHGDVQRQPRQPVDQPAAADDAPPLDVFQALQAIKSQDGGPTGPTGPIGPIGPIPSAEAGGRQSSPGDRPRRGPVRPGGQDTVQRTPDTGPPPGVPSSSAGLPPDGEADVDVYEALSAMGVVPPPPERGRGKTQPPAGQARPPVQRQRPTGDASRRQQAGPSEPGRRPPPAPHATTAGPSPAPVQRVTGVPSEEQTGEEGSELNINQLARDVAKLLRGRFRQDRERRGR